MINSRTKLVNWFIGLVGEEHQQGRNPRGQRLAIWYGNDTKTSYTYDPLTFRLRQQTTISLVPNEKLQDLYYFYDPVGNITTIKDDAEEEHFFDNHAVAPDQLYTYDALYRLIKAKGREHTGSGSFGSDDNYDDAPWMGIAHKGDWYNLQEYTQYYAYDAVGNITELQHSAASSGSYTRTYTYDTASNRLHETEISSTVYDYDQSGTGYDARGNMRKFPHLGDILYNAQNMMSYTALGGGGDAYYQYQSGQRIRKVWEKPGSIVEERIYLGNFEIHRRYAGGYGGTLTHERTTVHISDDTGRICMLESRTVGSGADPAILWRYMYANHLGSSALELDENAAIISYEEYHPYGTTAYQAMNATISAVAKRYRYTGKERDEETGLYYHGARYYIPWLARWAAADPLESDYAGWSSYNYGFDNPVRFTDPTGMQPDDGPQQLNSDQTKLINAFNSAIQQAGEDDLKDVGGTANLKIDDGGNIVWQGGSVYSETDVYRIVFLNKILGYKFQGQGAERSYEDENPNHLSVWEKAEQNITFFFTHQAPAFSRSEEGTKVVYDVVSKALFSGNPTDAEQAIKQINQSSSFFYRNFTGTIAVEAATLAYGGIKGLLISKTETAAAKDALTLMLAKMLNRAEPNIVKDVEKAITNQLGKTITDFDIILDKYIIEVTGGRGGGKVAQIGERILPNAGGKEVILFGPRVGRNVVRELEGMNVKTFRNFADLFNYLKK